MSNIVIQVNKKEMDKIRNYYQPYIIDKVPPGGVFIAKKNDCTITAYASGRILFQGKGNIAEAQKWDKNIFPSKQKSINRKTSGQPLPKNLSSLSVIGSDEVGKGDYFGPLVVAATYVKRNQIQQLKDLGVQDSKHLTDTQIVRMAKQLLTFLPYSLLILNNKKYNELQRQGMTQGKMMAILHNQVLANVLKKIAPEQPDAILVDQFAEANTYFRHLQGQKEIVKANIYFSTQAEVLHPAVATASILARYAFLRAMDQLSEKVGFSLTKGASSLVDEDAARIIKERGISALEFVAKVHFANTEKAKRLAGVTTD